MSYEDEFVTRCEFQECTKRTDEKIDKLRSDMNAGFLHITERLDAGFLHLTERMDDKFADVTQQLADQADAANERHAEMRRFLWTIAIALVGTAIGVAVLLFR